MLVVRREFADEKRLLRRGQMKGPRCLSASKLLMIEGRKEHV